MNGADDTYQVIFLEWQKEREKRIESVKNTATEVASNLKNRGITEIEFRYSGYGDSGCIEECSCEGNGSISIEEREKLEDLIYALLPSGWGNDEGSEGTITFDLSTGEVSVDHKWLQYVDEDIPGVELDLDDASED